MLHIVMLMTLRLYLRRNVVLLNDVEIAGSRGQKGEATATSFFFCSGQTNKIVCIPPIFEMYQNLIRHKFIGRTECRGIPIPRSHEYA